MDLPKLKGIGRNRMARFSLRTLRHKHTLQHVDSVSSVDSAGMLRQRKKKIVLCYFGSEMLCYATSHDSGGVCVGENVNVSE